MSGESEANPQPPATAPPSEDNSSRSSPSVDAETADTVPKELIAAATSSQPLPAKFRYVRLRPHRGNMVLGLGISGVSLAVFGSLMAMTLYICCPLWLVPLASLGLSIPAVNMGQADLAAMHALQMDPAGKESTKMGLICGIIGVSIIVTGALAIIFLAAFYAIVVSISSLNS